jgi:hypothetical protein
MGRAEVSQTGQRDVMHHGLEISVPARRRFQLVLVKPSHYDDDGYVIRWWRAMIPSNSLAAVYGIAADCAERKVLGSDVAIAIDAIDETHTRVNVPKLIEQFRRRLRTGCALSPATPT